MIRQVIVAALFFSAGASSQCPTTTAPNPPFVPSAPYSFSQDPAVGFLYGSEFLWTWVSTDPNWWGVGAPFRAKLFYARAGFDVRKEYAPPHLTVVARRLDAHASSLVRGEQASGVYGPGRARIPRSAAMPDWIYEDQRREQELVKSMGMLTMIDLPTAGCWEITAHYKDQALKYVVSLAPYRR
jgi:hypothetical protein